MSTLSRLFKYLVLTALLAACASVPNATPPGDGPGEAPPMFDLAGTHWSLVSLNGLELAPDTFISLEIAMYKLLYGNRQLSQ